MLGSVQHGGDALVRLNDAFAPDPVFLDVPAGVTVDGPVLLVHWCDPGAAAFPRLSVRAGEGAAVAVVEVFAGAPGPDRSLFVPVTELSAADGRVAARTCRCRSSATRPGRSPAWPARGDSGSSVRTFTVGLGGSYDRVRADVSVEGKDARSEILSAYLGDGSQVHDIRTLQDHAAPRTNSELLCQGAVAGRSRSVYSGLIRVHRGAVRSDARQTNHNLVLDEGAHADSVPNLDILENDVKCSHASTVGPDRRGPALLHRVTRRGARGGRGPHRAWLLRRHHRPWARSRGDPAPRARGARPSARPRSVAGGWPRVSETVALCTTDELASGEARRFDVDGHRIALVRIGDAFFAVDDECSHEDFSLSEGEVWADECQIECPRHGSTFDLVTGAALLAAGHPARRRLRRRGGRRHGVGGAAREHRARLRGQGSARVGRRP